MNAVIGRALFSVNLHQCLNKHWLLYWLSSVSRCCRGIWRRYEEFVCFCEERMLTVVELFHVCFMCWCLWDCFSFYLCRWYKAQAKVRKSLIWSNSKPATQEIFFSSFFLLPHQTQLCSWSGSSKDPRRRKSGLWCESSLSLTTDKQIITALLTKVFGNRFRTFIESEWRRTWMSCRHSSKLILRSARKRRRSLLVWRIALYDYRFGSLLQSPRYLNTLIKSCFLATFTFYRRNADQRERSR